MSGENAPLVFYQARATVAFLVYSWLLPLLFRRVAAVVVVLVLVLIIVLAVVVVVLLLLLLWFLVALIIRRWQQLNCVSPVFLFG